MAANEPSRRRVHSSKPSNPLPGVVVASPKSMKQLTPRDPNDPQSIAGKPLSINAEIARREFSFAGTALAIPDGMYAELVMIK